MAIRVPARELEGTVTKRVAQALRDPITLLADAGLPIEAARLPSINRTCGELAEQVSSKDGRLIKEVVERIVVTANEIEIALSGLALQPGWDMKRKSLAASLSIARCSLIAADARCGLSKQMASLRYLPPPIPASSSSWSTRANGGLAFLPGKPTSPPSPVRRRSTTHGYRGW